ncbi:MAG: polyprenyl synthetase family protein [Armatimonadota bacterium]
MNTKEALRNTGELIEESLESYLLLDTGPPQKLLKAMHYSTRGGKRVRAFLTIEAAKIFGLTARDVLPAAMALEFMHAASLIHDDMPCIDDSPMRRGRPSCHIQFDEHTALLAGDALIIRAFELLASLRNSIDPGRVARVVEEFAAATGAEGLIAGEAADIEGEQEEPNAEMLEYIHTNKTASLITAAARTGAILSGASEDHLRTLTTYARHLGLLFQITDDILDETATEQQLGKPVGADEASGKMTYPALMGLQKARQRAEKIADMASQQATLLPANAGVFTGLVDMVLNREK